MGANNQAIIQCAEGMETGFPFSEIVMGVRWNTHGEHAAVADLDALCVLRDRNRRILEVIHPGHPRNANGSVVHTGDAIAGAGNWDDERIFVFLNALPDEAVTLTLLVASASGLPLGEVGGALCHVSDRITEQAILRVHLSDLEGRRSLNIATLSRQGRQWKLTPLVQAAEGIELLMHTGGDPVLQPAPSPRFMLPSG